MIDQRILLMALLTLSFLCQCSSEIPSFLKICHRDDPHLNECIMKSFLSLKPFLRKGIPEFHVPVCEPLEIPKIKFDHNTGPGFLTFVFTNVKVKGATHFKIKHLNVDIKNNYIELKLFIPRLLMTANYDVNGKFMMLPIKSNGKANGNFSEIKTDVNINGIRYQNIKTNQTHYRVVNFDVIVDIGNGKTYFDNLFNGDKNLLNTMNQFLNENLKIIIEEFKPALELKIGDIFKKFSNEILIKYPLELLLPL
ncbi:hypothetical protein PV327_000424 [Microctonus hyperodae]|uniref:Uncharacterized protein n=1 Tax=Microctonus hyperodae TaxID=165561 RepID=A0AA39G7X7_MICHY|nr:hypothetical protein PV327_000424 [Microctonus hyperodae]